MAVKYWSKQLRSVESPSLKLYRQNSDKYRFIGNPEMLNFLCRNFKKMLRYMSGRHGLATVDLFHPDQQPPRFLPVTP